MSSNDPLLEPPASSQPLLLNRGRVQGGHRGLFPGAATSNQVMHDDLPHFDSSGSPLWKLVQIDPPLRNYFRGPLERSFLPPLLLLSHMPSPSRLGPLSSRLGPLSCHVCPLRLFDGEFLNCAREETASKHNPPACCLWVRFDATSMGHGLHEDIARGSDLGATQAVRIRRG